MLLIGIFYKLSIKQITIDLEKLKFYKKLDCTRNIFERTFLVISTKQKKRNTVHTNQKINKHNH